MRERKFPFKYNTRLNKINIKLQTPLNKIIIFQIINLHKNTETTIKKSKVKSFGFVFYVFYFPSKNVKMKSYPRKIIKNLSETDIYCNLNRTNLFELFVGLFYGFFYFLVSHPYLLPLSVFHIEKFLIFFFILQITTIAGQSFTIRIIKDEWNLLVYSYGPFFDSYILIKKKIWILDCLHQSIIFFTFNWFKL